MSAPGTGLAPVESAGAIEVASPALTREQVELLKSTICKGTTDDELSLFVAVCNRTRLDPFMRQIHAVKRWDRDAGREVMMVQVGIDGLRVLAQRTGRYAGRSAMQWCGGDGKWRDVWLAEAAPAAARVAVRHRDFPEAVVAVAHYREYVQRAKAGGPTRMWAEKPALMLAKCAEAQALRAAFPADLSGLYVDAELGGEGEEEGGPWAAGERDARFADLRERKAALPDEHQRAISEWAQANNVARRRLTPVLADTLESLIADAEAKVSAVDVEWLEASEPAPGEEAVPMPAGMPDVQRRRMFALAKKAWPDVADDEREARRKRVIAWASDGATESSAALTAEQAARVIEALDQIVKGERELHLRATGLWAVVPTLPGGGA